MVPSASGFDISSDAKGVVVRVATDLGHGSWRFADVLGNTTYDREGNDVQARGLYLEPPWQAAVFSLTRRVL
jgi:hypothetical protein